MRYKCRATKNRLKHLEHQLFNSWNNFFLSNRLTPKKLHWHIFFFHVRLAPNVALAKRKRFPPETIKTCFIWKPTRAHISDITMMKKPQVTKYRPFWFSKNKTNKKANRFQKGGKNRWDHKIFLHLKRLVVDEMENTNSEAMRGTKKNKSAESWHKRGYEATFFFLRIYPSSSLWFFNSTSAPLYTTTITGNKYRRCGTRFFLWTSTKFLYWKRGVVGAIDAGDSRVIG